MDERKSRRYVELVEKVKQKYRNHPVCTDKLELGWCDLLPGEDLCQEINLWTYWQGWGYAKDTQTDFNLIKFFSLIGKPDIHKNRYSDLFFCNCNLGYRKGNYSGNMTRRVLENDSQKIKELVDILQPKNIICLGLDTSVVMIRTLIGARFSCNNFPSLIGDGSPYQYGDTYIYPVAHPGYWGTMNRGVNNVEKDWMRIRK